MKDTNYMNFIPGVIPNKEKSDNDLWFIFCSNKLLVKVQDSSLFIPNYNDVSKLNFNLVNEHFLGELKNVSCYTIALPNTPDLPADMEFKDLRTAGLSLDTDLFSLCSKASQVLYWDSTHLYCGKCGSKTNYLPGERAKICADCGFITYPRICPAVIAAVVKGDKILLAHNANFANGMYSVIAGFVEPGETFEECVMREIFEEVGIKVKNIKYVSNQSWPFPNSHMIAFTAEYASGDITVDGIEITDASWFSVEEIPNIPSKISVGGKLINNFIENHKNKLK